MTKTPSIRIALSSPWTAAAVAFALHFGAVLVLGHFKTPRLWENGVIASYMLAGKGFAMDFAGPAAPTSWQAPGYPCLLYFFIKLFGNHPFTYLLISLLQSILTSLMVLPVSRLTRDWYGEKAAVVAAWVTAFMPLYAWYSTRLHQPAVVMSLYPWILLGWLQVGRSAPSAAFAILTGLATGIAALFSPTMLAVFGLLSGLLALRSLFQRDFRVLARIVVAGCFTLLAIAPWTARNYGLHGRLVPIKDSFPKELWYGNNPQATGTPHERGGKAPLKMPDLWKEQYGKVSEIEMLDAISEKTWEYVRSDIPAFARRTMTKILWFWTAVPRSLLRSSEEGEAVRFYWLHTGYWTAFLLASLLAVTWKRVCVPPDHLLILGIVFLVYSTVYGLTIVGNARFRGEIEFLLIPLLSPFLCHCVDQAILASAGIAKGSGFRVQGSGFRKDERQTNGTKATKYSHFRPELRNFVASLVASFVDPPRRTRDKARDKDGGVFPMACSIPRCGTSLAALRQRRPCPCLLAPSSSVTRRPSGSC